MVLGGCNYLSLYLPMFANVVLMFGFTWWFQVAEKYYFFCMTDQQYGRAGAFSFLEELSVAFLNEYRSQEGSYKKFL